MITAQQWNRTLLARQHLLERIDEDVIEVLDRCVGLRRRTPDRRSSGCGRASGFDPAEYDELLTEREIVRSVVLRGTLMVMDAQDARWMRALAQTRIAAITATNHKLPPGIRALDVVDAGREALKRGGGARACTAGPARGALAVSAARRPDGRHRGGLHLVQVPPRGTWDGAGDPALALLDDWIGPGEPAVVDDRPAAT